MNEQKNQAVTLSNPRILSAAYFALLAIIVTILIEVIIYSLGMIQIIAPFKAILLSVIIAAVFGAIFGERIVHSRYPYRMHVFWWAFLMVILAIPIYALGLLIFLHQEHTTQFGNVGFNELIPVYLIIVFYSFIFAGLWMAILAGIAAIFLRSHIADYLSRSLYKLRKNPPNHKVDSSHTAYDLEDLPVDSKKK